MNLQFTLTFQENRHSLEPTEEQLDGSGGLTPPFIALGYGIAG
jgi:hypothetical protein